ncbi:MAG: aminotransferase class I/II-fold pyridoxal phosphate-dependent enzyme [Deltaproteobacteria bacterium]|nr:aminotransferase class I/II-fold pyridoxal phosphate-dependent enzyme [Deltaproteobacteria bacterium]
MQQAGALMEQVKTLKSLAATMQEGRIYTHLIPEIDKILALPDPDDLAEASISEREAVARQVREYEQSFDSLGFSLLNQIMPSTGVSNIFRIVQAADDFNNRLKKHVGITYEINGKQQTLDARHIDALTRYSLSIGTPPVTAHMRDVVSRIVFGKEIKSLYGYVETLGVNHEQYILLIKSLARLIDSSLHYNTNAEERAFLVDATEFVNFEGANLFNRVVITESPKRVIDLIQKHVFDKFGPSGVNPVRLVPGIDRLDDELIAHMRAEPNQVFVTRVTRIPHGVFSCEMGLTNKWRSIIGRLILIDCSERARLSNTTIVYTLFPHVVQTLRNIQTRFAGRPANTQLVLRQILERFSPDVLDCIGDALDSACSRLEDLGILTANIDEIRAYEWRRDDLFDYLTFKKMCRMVRFITRLARGDDEARQRMGEEIAKNAAQKWMKYFYSSLNPKVYTATLVPGGGRGALTLIGEFHREQVRKAVADFCSHDLAICRQRLIELKRELSIPEESSDEIKAAIKQSQLLALAPTQWDASKLNVSKTDYLTKSLFYRAAHAAGRLTRKTEESLEKAAYGNFTGGVAALLKNTMSKFGLGALHGHLEHNFGSQVSNYDRKVRKLLTPFHEAVRSAQRAMDDLRGEIDPTAVGEIEALLKVIERGSFYPILIMPAMSWSYDDVFPEKYFPASDIIRVPLNRYYELDPVALLSKIEELRYSLRRFPEVFYLYCRSMILVLNTPHNPTGVTYRRESILRLLQLASEYGITILDDNAYHKLVTRDYKAREGDLCVAQIYEHYRDQISKSVRIITIGATTKGLQGSGDRTGIIHSNYPEAVEYAHKNASAPHLMSLYLTLLKLENGLAVKRYTHELEKLAGRIVDLTSYGPIWATQKELLTGTLAHISQDDFPVIVFAKLLDGYDHILRLQQRGASIRHLSEALSNVVRSLKKLRLEVRLRRDVQKRIDALLCAHQKVIPDTELIPPSGAFYACFKLVQNDDNRNIHEFLNAIARYRKVDVTYAGKGFIRASLGGLVIGDYKSYIRFEKTLEVYLKILTHYWNEFEKLDRDVEKLKDLFKVGGPDEMQHLLHDLEAIFTIEGYKKPIKGMGVRPSEWGSVYCIEEGKSIADKVFIKWQPCNSVDEMIDSRTFRVLYRRLLKKVCRRHPELLDLTFTEIQKQYGPLACLSAYYDRQLIDPVFRQLLTDIYNEWHGASTIKVLTAELKTNNYSEKVATLHGLHSRLNVLINELMYAFEIPENKVTATTTFEIGYEELSNIKANSNLPEYLQHIVQGTIFAGATAALDPDPKSVTGAVKRVSDYRYGFILRHGSDDSTGSVKPELSLLQSRLSRFAETADLDSYVCKAIPVGPFKILLVMHKSYFQFISDEMRLFPQIPEMQLREKLNGSDWDAVLLFGIPAKCMGESYKTGYIIDKKTDGRILPTAWVAREEDTDYFGFFKKSILTLHNELVKALGGMPVHGAMITITFKNGLRKTLVFSADSGTGKSETITAMMDQLASGDEIANQLKSIDILAGDMLSLWCGEDRQVYAFGTEQGDFMRLTDITESWKRRFGDLLKRGSYSNLDHPKNPRVTIPGICNPNKFLSPTRVNGFFYINNYEPVYGSSVELSDDPHYVLKNTLVRGLRKNKGTAGDQPSLRAGLEFAGRSDLVVRYRHTIDDLLEWHEAKIQGRFYTCLGYRNGADDVFTAHEVISAAFINQSFVYNDKPLAIDRVDYDVLKNVYMLMCNNGMSIVLSREVYDQIYEPLVSTFCGNPFVHPEGMDKVLEVFADIIREAKIHTGVIKTQLARNGYEFSGAAKAARDIVTFLLEDEEVSSRFQRNKDKVLQAMQSTFGGILEDGTNLPIELEGYNLLLLEAHESTHVTFVDDDHNRFTLSTPFYRYEPSNDRYAPREFAPAIAVPEMINAIEDICQNLDYEIDLSDFHADLCAYDRIRFWNSREELVFQILLINGVISIGASENEVARFPLEVRKANHIAAAILARRSPELGTWVPRFKVASTG